MRGAGLGTAFGQERPTVKRVSSRSTPRFRGGLAEGEDVPLEPVVRLLATISPRHS